jgi:anti-anti-sigma factor
MRISERNGATVAVVTDDEFENPYKLEDAFERLIEKLKRRALVLDLSSVRSVNSLGIAVLVAAQGLAMIHETRVVLTGVASGVRRVLQVSGADQVLAVSESVDDALGLLAVPGRG